MFRPTFALGFAVLLAACGGDDSPNYEISLSTSDRTLNASGRDGAQISISVQDKNTGDPAPLFDRVIMSCQDSSGVASGWLGDSATEGQGQVTLDALGLGSVTFRCSADPGSTYSVQCLAIYEGKTGFLTPLTCASDSDGS